MATHRRALLPEAQVGGHLAAGAAYLRLYIKFAPSFIGYADRPRLKSHRNALS
jgi:hypothetical protein